MNAVELETIASQLALLRQQARPANPSPQTRPARTGNRATSPNEAGNTKRFNPQIHSTDTNLQPFGPRPRISSVRGKRYEAVAALGHSKLAWAGAFCLVGIALFRAAAHVGFVGGPVVVHLVWPV